MDCLQDQTVNGDKEPAETQQTAQTHGGRKESHPLLTTAECPKRLVSLCRPGLGRTLHSSQAEKKKWKHVKYGNKELKHDF